MLEVDPYNYVKYFCFISCRRRRHSSQEISVKYTYSPIPFALIDYKALYSVLTSGLERVEVSLSLQLKPIQKISLG
jgi:hypothetical protein